MEIANIDSITFDVANKKHIRVYYQTKDKKLRETCYESGSGWFVRQGNIITENAMANTPITAARWVDGDMAHIRVYYLNDARQICECKGEYNPPTGITTWQSGAALQLNKATNVASGSSLAVARPDRNDATLRIFYQEGKSPANSNTCPIREIKYRKSQNKWLYQNSMITDALENTRFTAVSAGKTGTVRVYYQGSDSFLRVTLWDSDAGNWRNSKRINEDNKLAPRAPIKALAWYGSETYEVDDLRVRVYTILASSPKNLYEFARNGEDWDDPTPVADNQHVTSENMSIGVCRERTFNDDAPIFVFFKPKPDYVDFVFPHVGSTLTTQVQDSFRPHGIPISL
ncbi:hypothetical protein F5Y09DRAFT_304888 [Xylaria sp. FL1042]|nr:hypothetical protein F5Y09DRAFT_304888 [Xylaria sp. FL1042]